MYDTCMSLMLCNFCLRVAYLLGYVLSVRMAANARSVREGIFFRVVTAGYLNTYTVATTVVSLALRDNTYIHSLSPVFTRPEHMCCLDGRTGRFRELAMSSSSLFKMVWHQFRTVQFPSHQFDKIVRSVQFGAR